MESAKRFLLVEDDYMQSASLAELLTQSYPGARVDLIETEHAFREDFPRIAAANYHLIILDVMLRWADPAPGIPEPDEEVDQQGHHWAGIRCMWKLKSDPRTAPTPVMLYTIHDPEALKEGLPELPPGVSHHTKGTNGAEFVNEVQRLLTSSAGMNTPSE